MGESAFLKESSRVNAAANFDHSESANTLSDRPSLAPEALHVLAYYMEQKRGPLPVPPQKDRFPPPPLPTAYLPSWNPADHEWRELALRATSA